MNVEARDRFLGSIRARDNEYKTFKALCEKRLEEAKKTSGVQSPEYSRCSENYYGLEYPIPEAECKVARSILSAMEKGTENAVVVDDFTTIWDKEIREFCKILESLECRKILWMNNSSGMVDTLAEFADNGWNVTGITGVGEKPAVILEAV